MGTAVRESQVISPFDGCPLLGRILSLPLRHFSAIRNIPAPVFFLSFGRREKTPGTDSIRDYSATAGSKRGPGRVACVMGRPIHTPAINVRWSSRPLPSSLIHCLCLEAEGDGGRGGGRPRRFLSENKRQHDEPSIQSACVRYSTCSPLTWKTERCASYRIHPLMSSLHSNLPFLPLL